jgi:peptidase M1-like protein
VTKVLIRLRDFVLLGWCVVWGTLSVAALQGSPHEGVPQIAEGLYAQLRSVGLDKSRVYTIRDASLDRSALHITFENGTIAFSQDTYGRITGAFFVGEGEVLLSPPNATERASMALFTGMAILEEQFVSGYFRFNDDVYAEMQPALRPANNAEEFIAECGETAQRFAEFDALRLLISFSHFLPIASPNPAPASRRENQSEPDRMLHARLQGRKLGAFDLYFDTTIQESIWAGQSRTTEGTTYYDVWTSFDGKHPPSQPGNYEQKQDDVTITRYKIRADVKPPTELNGDARLQLEIGRGGQRTLLFELSRFLQVKSVDLNGRGLEFINNQALEGTQLERRGNDLVAVVFPAPLKAGEKLELHFVYAGGVLSEAGSGLLYVGARGTWYPNRGLAMSNFDLEFHYPPGWTLLATGKRTPVPNPSAKAAASSAAAEFSGEQIARWVSERPMPIAGFNLGKYTRAVARAGEVLVESYATRGVERTFPKPTTTEVVTVPDVHHHMPSQSPPMAIITPPPSPARNAQPVADQSARAIEFFARRFGPFPYSSLELTQMPGPMSQGWPGLVFLSSYSFLTPAERKTFHMDRLEALLSAQVPTHETAHQWWGDLVSWRSYRDQWMMEALANYSAMMLLESEDPSAFRDLMEKFRHDLLEKNKEGQVLRDAGPVTLGTRLSSSHFPNGYDAISYGRGTWLFHMLREMMRDAQSQTEGRSGRTGQADEPFIRSLRKLRERYQGKVITTRELLHLFEEDLPPNLRYENRKSLDWFLNGWINGTAMPVLELEGVKYLSRDNSTIVTGTLLQKDAPSDLVTAVPVYASLGGKRTVFLGRVFADGAETTFRLNAPPGTRHIVLDPHQTLLTAAH